MDALRWILLGVAIVIVVAVYFFSRNRKQSYERSPLDAANEAPSFSARADEKLTDGWMDGVGPVRVVSNELDPDSPELEQVLEEAGFQDEVVTADPADYFSQTSGTEQTRATQHVSATNSAADKKPAAETESLPEAKTTPVENSRSSRVELNPQKKIAEDNQHKTPQKADDNEAEAEAVDDVVAVYVLASTEEPVIKGEKILSASYALQLEFGEMNIFHRHTESSDDNSKNKDILFSMANMRQPGYFDIDNMHHLETPGLSFFMQVNLLENPSRVLDDMLICAHKMSTMLGAQLCNAHRKPLDEAYTNSLRAKVKQLIERRNTQAV